MIRFLWRAECFGCSTTVSTDGKEERLPTYTECVDMQSNCTNCDDSVPVITPRFCILVRRAG